MYFLSQYKNLLLASCVFYQQAPENAGIFSEKNLEDSEKELKEHLQKMRELLSSLKQDIEAPRVDKIQEFEIKMQTLQTSESVIALKIQTLQALLEKESTFIQEKDFSVPTERLLKYDEIQKIQDRFIEQKREYNELVEEIEAIQRTLETFTKNKLTEVEQKKFQTITNKEFLSLSPQERLRFVNVGNVSAADVAAGKQKHLEFTFTYDGVFNRDFYIRTTAGQVLPREVREVSAGWEVFTRWGLQGEFFTPSGKRLKIHEGTQIDITQLARSEELQKIQDTLQKQKEVFVEHPLKDFTDAALEREIDPKFALIMFGKEIEKSSWGERKVLIEERLTDIARFQDDFVDDYPGKKSFKWGNVTEAFAGYLVNILAWDREALVKEYGFKKENLQSFRKSDRYSAGGPLRMENVNIDWVNQAEIEQILKMKRFIPGSRDAQILFTYAAKAAGLPEGWGTDAGLHYILSRESAGIVGRLNYTIPKSYTPEQFKRISLERKNNNPLGVTSTASGLGQMLLSNVDKYYPDGRAGIGDALSEAVGMLRYIHDRYGSVEVARSVYGKVASYTHAVTGKHKNKSFQEGY